MRVLGVQVAGVYGKGKGMARENVPFKMELDVEWLDPVVVKGNGLGFVRRYKYGVTFRVRRLLVTTANRMKQQRVLRAVRERKA